MDIFAQLRRFESVEKVSNLYSEASKNVPLDFFFFLCPKMKGSGLKLNRNKTGLTAEYVEGLNTSTPQRISRVKRFLEEFKTLKIPFTCKGVLSLADAIILFPVPARPPVAPLDILGIPIISNYELVKMSFVRFAGLLNEKPWERSPGKVRESEFARLSEMLKYANPPQNLIQDFVERIWAGFALDGILAKEGKFGDNPILLGVESPYVVMLQNAALPREKWLPTIQLR